MSAVIAIAILFVKAVQVSVDGMPAWQAAHHIPVKVRPVLR
jgi:hypothetical protein